MVRRGGNVAPAQPQRRAKDSRADPGRRNREMNTEHKAGGGWPMAAPPPLCTLCVSLHRGYAAQVTLMLIGVNSENVSPETSPFRKEIRVSTFDTPFAPHFSCVSTVEGGTSPYTKLGAHGFSITVADGAAPVSIDA